MDTCQETPSLRERSEQLIHNLAMDADGWFFETDEDAERFHKQATKAVFDGLADVQREEMELAARIVREERDICETIAKRGAAKGMAVDDAWARVFVLEDAERRIRNRKEEP